MLERGYYDARLAIYVDSIGSFCVGDGGLLDSGMRRFGGEDYWCSSPVGCGGDVHDTRHIHACVDVGKSREVLEEDLSDC